MTHTRHIYPELIPRPDLYPEVVGWNVKDSTDDLDYGKTIGIEMDNRTLYAPFEVGEICPCGEDHGYGAQMREMGHLMFTSASAAHEMQATAGLPMWLMGVVEDVRVDRRLTLAGYGEVDGAVCGDIAGNTFAAYWDDIRRYDSYIGQNGVLFERAAWYCFHAFIVAMASRAGRNWVQRKFPSYKNMYVYETESTYKALMEIGSILQTLIVQHEDPTSEQWMRATYKIHKILGNPPANYKNENDSQEAGSMTGKQSDKKIDPAERSWESLEDETVWAPMTVMEPHRSIRMREAARRGTTSRDEGTNPQNIHRISTDGRLFRLPKRKKTSYAVLVDCSGSMSWPEEEIHDLLEKTPNATLAAYSGEYGQGYLKIYAVDGVRVADSELTSPPGGSNAIDGTALRWLNEQRGKRRVWLSDGSVNGPGNTLKTYQDAAVQVQRGKVMRVRRGSDMLAVVTGKKEHKPTPWRNAVAWGDDYAYAHNNQL